MSRLLISLFVVSIGLGVLFAGPVPKDLKPKSTDPNSNALVQLHRDKLKLEASSCWDGWPVEQLFDEKVETAWYSRSGDSPQSGQTPWVRATFPEDVSVKRLTVLGNRDPQYVNSYLVLEGKFELLDQDGKVIASQELKATGDKHDFDWILDKKTKVRSVRFTATKDQEQYNCVGLSEFQVE